MKSLDIFEILVRENAEMLSVYIRSTVKDAVLADDLFQETMIVAWQRLDDYDRSRPFGAWLRGIARKLTLASYRKRGRLPISLQTEILDQIDTRWQQLQTCAGDNLEEKIEGLQQCLEQLPDRLRATIELRYTEGVKGQSLADRLQLPLENVKKRMQRGREALLHCMQRHMKAQGV